MNDLRTAAQQALEALKKYRHMMFVEAGCRFGEGDAAITALRAALAQQAEPDHETRAELAEQQVVQLAEERDHYRNLWQKAQQAEPLTDEQISDLWCEVSNTDFVTADTHVFARAVERALSIGRQTDPQIEDRFAHHGIPKP